MTQQNDNEVHAKVARLLDLMGQMMQEVSALVQSQAAGTFPDVTAAETERVVAEPPGPPLESGAPEAEPTTSAEEAETASEAEQTEAPIELVADVARNETETELDESEVEPASVPRVACPMVPEPPTPEREASLEGGDRENSAAPQSPAEEPAAAAIRTTVDAEFAHLFGDDDPAVQGDSEATHQASEQSEHGNELDVPAQMADDTILPSDPAAAPVLDQSADMKSTGTGPADEEPPGSEPAIEEPAKPVNQLYLVCEGEEEHRLAIPWGWIVDTQLSQTGAPEAFTLADGDHVRRMKVKKVRGIWSARELADWSEEVTWVHDLAELAQADPLPLIPTSMVEPASAARSLPTPDVDSDHTAPDEPREHDLSGARTTHTVVLPEVPSERGAVSAIPNPPTGTNDPPVPNPPPVATLELNSMDHALTEANTNPRPGDTAGSYPAVWVVSPSALARRFLMRHLDETGIEVHEARDLDDPLLPADLKDAGALFLDESLLEHWSAHPTVTTMRVPLVLLTVDGSLRVPAAGVHSSEGAALPRPFERSEVETVVTWLRSLWDLDSAGGNGAHGDPQDNTWLFADPFGDPDAGERPGSR